MTRRKKKDIKKKDNFLKEVNKDGRKKFLEKIIESKNNLLASKLARRVHRKREAVLTAMIKEPEDGAIHPIVSTN